MCQGEFCLREPGAGVPLNGRTWKGRPMFKKRNPVRLTALTDADAPALFAYRSNPAVWRYQTWIPTSVTEAFSFIRTFGRVTEPRGSGWTQFAIRNRETGVLLGDCGCHMMQDHVAEIGYTIAPAFQGRGYATEAVGQLVVLLARHDVHRAIARTDTRNIRSMKLLERLGFRADPTASESYRLRGETVTDFCYVRTIQGKSP